MISDLAEKLRQGFALKKKTGRCPVGYNDSEVDSAS
jgi:hypothetical protein